MIKLAINIYKKNPHSHLSKFLLRLYRAHKKRKYAEIDYQAEFWQYFDPQKPVAFLWGFDKKRAFYWHEFFADEQTLLFDSTATLKEAFAQIGGAKATVYVKSYARQSRIESVAKKYGAKVVYLARGLIGHPTRLSFPACFKILNPDDATPSPELVEEAKKLRRLYVELGINYMGSPSFIDTEKYLGVTLGERILVVAGKPRGMLAGARAAKARLRLTETALRENPSANVYVMDDSKRHAYVPMERTVRIDGKKRSYFLVRKPLRPVDMIAACDVVYTNGAPHALDAVIREKRVIVTGKPFYAGCGLTEDRAKGAFHQKTPVTIDEFFARHYLLNTKYPYGSGDRVKGMLATMLEAGGRYDLARDKKSLNAKNNAHSLNALSESDNNIALLASAMGGYDVSEGIRNIWSFPIKIASKTYYRVIAAAFLGVAYKNKKLLPHVFTALQKSVPGDVIIQETVDLLRYTHDLSFLPQIEEVTFSQDKFKESQELLLRIIESKKADADAGERSASKKLVTHANIAFEKKLAVTLKNRRNVEGAKKALLRLLLSGFSHKDVFMHVADVAASQFDFIGAAEINKIAGVIGGDFPKALQDRVKHLYVAGEGKAMAVGMAKALIINPSFAERITFFPGLLRDTFGDVPFERAFQEMVRGRLSVQRRDANDEIKLAKADMHCERHDEQYRRIQRIKEKNPQYYSLLLLYYIHTGNHDKARSIAEGMITKFPGLNAFREAVTLAVRMDDYAWAKQLFSLAENKSVQKSGSLISEMLYRKYNFGVGNIHDAYKSFRALKKCQTLKEQFPEKYVQSSEQLAIDAGSLAIFAIFGPGDELRFASLYREFLRLYEAKKICISCGDKLYALMVRSFPEIEIFPIARLRDLHYSAELSRYNLLPHSDLVDVFDNNALDAMERCDAFTLVTDQICEVVQDKQSIPGTPYLIADDARQAFFRSRLPGDGKPIVGISWASSLRTFSRNEHYLKIEDLQPVFDQFAGRAHFVNLQYDNPVTELAWVAEHCAAPIVHFDDLDQYNDLDGVAALMTCMDVIIAPATTVVELAGALGRQTLLLSNSSELHWREIDERGTDVWHHSVRHVRGDIVGDKKSLVANLIKTLEETLRGEQAHAA
ncbi:MAG: hypothetical protein ABW189_05260 [Rickettsiales bacterium]